MQPAAIVINSSLTRDIGRFRRRCREAAAGGGWQPSFLETTLDDRGVGLAGAAVAAGARMVATAFGGHERRIDLAVAEAAAAGADGAGTTGAGITGAGTTGGGTTGGAAGL